MLAAGRRVRPEVPLLAGDALRLPFADATFDAVTISFALRNVSDPDAALRELARVTRPGGRLVVCEFSTPTNPVFRTVYGLQQPGRLRLPRRVDPGLARPAGVGRADRRVGVGSGGLAQPHRRHRGAAPGGPRLVTLTFPVIPFWWPLPP
jgi:SAM-dependent methyltransferase